MSREELWTRARDEAGFSADEAVWLELPGEPPGGERGTWSLSVPSGAHPDPSVAELNDEQQRWCTAHIDKRRVLTYAGVSDAAALGLMRWATAYGRLEASYPEALTLVLATHRANQERILPRGAGGAAYHHASPDQSYADAAAGSLVTAMLGEQLGDLKGMFGPVFRPGRPMPDDLFPARAVCFAAFHHDDLQRQEREHGLSVDGFVGAVGANARSWLNTLLDDEGFRALSAAAPFTMPTAEETAARGYAVDLWATAVDLYERAEDRGLALLQQP